MRKVFLRLYTDIDHSFTNANLQYDRLIRRVILLERGSIIFKFHVPIKVFARINSNGYHETM